MMPGVWGGAGGRRPGPWKYGVDGGPYLNTLTCGAQTVRPPWGEGDEFSLHVPRLSPQGPQEAGEPAARSPGERSGPHMCQGVTVA